MSASSRLAIGGVSIKLVTFDFSRALA